MLHCQKEQNGCFGRNSIRRIIAILWCVTVLPAAAFAPKAGQQAPGANENAREKLVAELKKYAVVYGSYDETNYPVLSGNTAMGGLLDPLGRGIYNIEVNGLFLAPDRRVFGPGMMLGIAQFSGHRPERYRQEYSLENGILTTDADYGNGAYHSEMFFSQDNRDLTVYRLSNKGKHDLVCNIDIGRFELTVENHTAKSIYGMSRKGSFTCLHYFLQSNISMEMPAMPDSKDIFVKVPPGKTLEIVLSLRVTAEHSPLPEPHIAATADLVRNHIRKWQELWQSLGVIILPEGDYARAFYRSLHWLQCTAGAAGSLPGECQFGTFTSGAAAAYQFHGQAALNVQPWNQRPFTYGAAGWSLYAYILLGDSARAGNMIASHYRPEALRKNVTAMFPVGDHEFTYGGKPKGRYGYLSHDNPDAICFAHEMLNSGANHDAAPWDKQVHIQGFAPSMFYRYSRMYGDKADTAYSVMKGSAEFWRTLVNYDAAQKSYVIPPLLSLTEDLFEAGLLDAAIAAKWTLNRAAVLAEERNVDAGLRKQWKQIAKNIRIKDRNGIYLEFEGDDGSRAGAGYQGIRGYAYLGFPALETVREFPAQKVNRSLDQCWERNGKGKGMITFIANWFALTDAYCGRAEEAYEKSAYCLTQLDPSGTAMSEQNGMFYYFLTGYSSFTMVPVSMVLQSTDSDIKVFPAVPEAFADIAFYDLPATNGIRVSGEMKNGEIQYVRFKKDGKLLLETSGKAPVRFTISDLRF
jgi:hypothetical protein